MPTQISHEHPRTRPAPDDLSAAVVLDATGHAERLPSIGVVVPSFNQGRYIGACLRSLRAQHYPGLSVHIMDGGSTDASLATIAEFGEFSSQSGPDGGQAAAINAGSAKVEGDWIAWLNSDDFYLPSGLRELGRLAAQHPNAAAIVGRAQMVDEAGREFREYPSAPFSEAVFRKTCRICQPAVLIRRSAWDAAGGLDPSLACCLDYDLWFRLAAEGELVFCDRLVAASRHYAETKTSSRRLRALVEAGRLLQRHTGSAHWRWSVKWVVHRWTLDRRRFVFPVLGQVAALRSAWRYQRRYGSVPGGRAIRKPSRGV